MNRSLEQLIVDSLITCEARALLGDEKSRKAANFYYNTYIGKHFTQKELLPTVKENVREHLYGLNGIQERLAPSNVKPYTFFEYAMIGSIGYTSYLLGSGYTESGLAGIMIGCTAGILMARYFAQDVVALMPTKKKLVKKQEIDSRINYTPDEYWLEAMQKQEERIIDVLKG